MVCLGKFTGNPHTEWENPWFPIKIIPSNQPNEAILSHLFVFLSIFKCPAAEFQKGTGTASAPVPPAHVMTCHDKASVSIIKNHNVVNAIATHEQFTQYSDTQKLEVERLRKHDNKNYNW